MRVIPQLKIFVRHYDWYTKDEKGNFVPTELAPQEAVEAMRYCNKLNEQERKHNDDIL